MREAVVLALVDGVGGADGLLEWTVSVTVSVCVDVGGADSLLVGKRKCRVVEAMAC